MSISRHFSMLNKERLKNKRIYEGRESWMNMEKTEFSIKHVGEGQQSSGSCVWLQIESRNADKLPQHSSEYFPCGNMRFRS